MPVWSVAVYIKLWGKPILIQVPSKGRLLATYAQSSYLLELSNLQVHTAKDLIKQMNIFLYWQIKPEYKSCTQWRILKNYSTLDHLFLKTVDLSLNSTQKVTNMWKKILVSWILNIFGQLHVEPMQYKTCMLSGLDYKFLGCYKSHTRHTTGSLFLYYVLVFKCQHIYVWVKVCSCLIHNKLCGSL